MLEKTLTLMLTDVEASTTLATRKGDVEARELLARYKHTVRGVLAKHHGREIDSPGDAFFVAFESARNGIRCALEIHDYLSKQRIEGSAVRVRIGLNAGDVVCSGAEIFGSAISAAARLAGVAGGGEVLISDVVKKLASPMPGAAFIDRGAQAFRGFDEPVQVFEVKEERLLSIAVAEDNLLVREGVLSVLGLCGDMRVVATCGDLAAIQEAITQKAPDVVVTDIRMPPTGTDEGLQLADWLGRTDPSVAVVALSQYVDDVYVRRLFASSAGGRAFLLKESVGDRNVLRDAIRTAAGGGTYLDPGLDRPTDVAPGKGAP